MEQSDIKREGRVLIHRLQPSFFHAGAALSLSSIPVTEIVTVIELCSTVIPINTYLSSHESCKSLSYRARLRA